MVFLMLPHFAIAAMTMLSCDSHIARDRCIQNDELHSSNCFRSFVVARGGACCVHVALRARSLGRCGAYLLAACMSGCFRMHVPACFVCVCLSVFVSVGPSFACLAPACFAFPLFRLSLSVSFALSASLSLSFCLSSGNDNILKRNAWTQTPERWTRLL